ncbi:hypothetical protein [Desulfovibrio sp. UCD-KL4C]|uniref:hypothetical protein n=1 Tax=Desulfovibrio sp. UCD-KL4C TaxID=2578120 RepID=UPI0025BA0FAD|nr:hypothetical protein [Desulfovibrio sp. UCD-KL4C]
MIKNCYEKISRFGEKIADLGVILVGLPNLVRIAIKSEPMQRADFEYIVMITLKISTELNSCERAYAQANKAHLLKSIAKINFLAKKILLEKYYLFHLILSENKLTGIYPKFVTDVRHGYCGVKIRYFDKGRLLHGDFSKDIFVSRSICYGRSFYEKRIILLFRPVLEVLLCSQRFLNDYRESKEVNTGMVNDLLYLRKALLSYSYTGFLVLEDIVHFLNHRREMNRESSIINEAFSRGFVEPQKEKEEDASPVDNKVGRSDVVINFLDELRRERPDSNLINIYLAIAIHDLLEATQSTFGTYDELWELMGDKFKSETPYQNRIPFGSEVRIYITGEVLNHIGLSETTSGEVSIKKKSFEKNNGPHIRHILPKIKDFCELRNIRNIPIIP